MKNTKIKFTLFLLSALLILLSILGFRYFTYSTYRYPYSPDTRQVNSSQFMLTYLPSMETNLRLSDIVVRGRVTSDAQSVDTITTLTGKTGVFIAEDFDFHVEEVLFGSLDTDTITLRCWGKDDAGCAKPHRNDELILFLSVQPTTDFAYIPVSDESSMFAVMPDESLYSFSNQEEFTTMDGRPVEDIYQRILEAAQNIHNNPEEYVDIAMGGEVLTELLDPESNALNSFASIIESAS